MPAPSDPNAVLISRAELLWLTLGTWLGGVCMLTLLPLLLVPRFGVPVGMVVSYLLFFVAWQPLQKITQRVLGTGPALVRMLAFVIGAAVIAYYLREALVAMSRV